MRAFELLVVGDHVRAGALLPLEAIGTVAIELRSGRIESQEYLLARFVTGLVDRRQNQIESLGAGFEVGSEATFVAD